MASLPPWERGLKFFYFPAPSELPDVAPFAGAWIEISFFAQDTPPDGVAPLAEGELKKVNLELLVSSNALM